MTLTDALAVLRTECDTTSWPQLTDADLTAVLTRARRADSDGRGATDPAWTPTWDIDDACARGWELKAGRAASGFDFSADGNTYNRSQVAAGCREQAKTYRRRLTSLPLGDDRSGAPVGYVWPWTVY